MEHLLTYAHYLAWSLSVALMLCLAATAVLTYHTARKSRGFGDDDTDGRLARLLRLLLWLGVAVVLLWPLTQLS